MSELPWELLVLGVPASLQATTATRQGWKTHVARAARAAWAGPPIRGDVSFEMVSYFEGRRRADVDNIIKYTQDALSGIVYEDDAQVVQTSSTVLDIDGEYVCRGMSEATARGFMADMPFVVARVHPVAKRRRLP